MNVQMSQTRSIIPRALQSRAARAFKLALDRLPPRVKQLGLRALTPVMKRWPTVLSLLGIESPARPSARPAPRGPAAVRRDENGGGSQLAVWLRVLKTDADMASRIRAVRELARRVTPAATAALVAALRDPSAEVAAEAADALRYHAAEPVIIALRNVVSNTDGYFAGGVRAAAIRTLSAILPRGEGEPITAAIADPDAEVSVAAIAGVVDRNEMGGTEALMSVLENPRGYYVALTRGAAARGLKGLGMAPDPARLRAVLEAEHDREIREILSGMVA